MKQKIKKRLIVVLGMHRSGTSAITRGLQTLGVNLGENLISPRPDNEKGFWEDIDIVQLNIDVLRHLNLDWNTLATIDPTEFDRKDLSPFRLRAIDLLRRKTQGVSSFGIKDPRIALLLPYWKPLFDHIGTSLGYVIAVRNPISVARSLKARNGLEPEYTHYLWLQHVVPSILNSSGSPRVVVDYDLVLEKPMEQLHRIAESLDLHVDATTSAFKEYSKGFLEERLRHSRFRIEDLRLDPAVPVEVQDAYTCLDRIARDVISVESPEVHALFSQLEQRLKGLSPIFGYIRARESSLATLQQTISERDGQLVALQGTVTSRDTLIAERDSHVATLQHVLSERDSHITERDSQLTALNHAVAHRDALIAERDGQLATLHQTLADRENRLTAVKQSLVQRDDVIADRESQLANLQSALEERDSQLAIAKESLAHRDALIVAERDEKISTLHQALTDREGQLAAVNQALLQRDAIIADRDTQLAGLQQAISERENRLAGVKLTLAQRDGAVAEREAQLAALQNSLNDSEAQLALANEDLAQRDVVIAERDTQVAALQQAIAHHDTSLLQRDRKIESLTLTATAAKEEIDSLLRTLSAKQEQVTQRDQELHARDSRLHELAAFLAEKDHQIAALDQTVRAIYLSRSWRITKPLRSLMGLTRRLLKYTHNALLAAHSTLVRIGTSAPDTPSLPSSNQPDAPAPMLQPPGAAVFNLTAYPTVYILTTPHCSYVAQLISRCFEKVGVKAKILFERPTGGYRPVPHIVICPQMFSELPQLYVAFQMEQSVNPRWFDQQYFRTLEHSYAIFDYSIDNIAFLQKNGLSHRQIYYMPLSYLSAHPACGPAPHDTEFDVIFYGDPNNDRRQAFLQTIKSRFRVRVISDLFGEALYSELRNAKVVVNIHYYEGALLETARIYESLSIGCLVISEKSVDFDAHTDIHNIVDFVELGDIDGMISRISYWLSSEANRIERIAQNRSALESLPNHFEFYFLRFLLATGSISFDKFYELAGSHIRFDSNFICLGLPETTARRDDFNRDNRYGIQYFPGLRHPLGWIGCGLSYKFILRKANEHNFAQVKVCEDDVKFHNGWDERLRIIDSYLAERMGDWDVFSGMIADLHNDVIISKVERYQGEDFIHMDRLTSMVMNIYSSRFFDRLLQWDERNFDAQSNTVDRFIEKQPDVRVITTLPFLVGHKESLSSTLWGFSNSQYNDLIKTSMARLAEKVRRYRRQFTTA